MANVLIGKQYAAYNTDSYNRSVIHTTQNIDNGCVMALNAYQQPPAQTTPGVVWVAEAPTAATDAGLWMAKSPVVVRSVLWDGTDGAGTALAPAVIVNGIISDPRAFTNVANVVFDAILLMEKDVLEMTGDGIANIATMDYLVPTAGSFTLTATNTVGTGLCLKKIGVSHLHINGGGGFASDRPITYKFEVISN